MSIQDADTIRIVWGRFMEYSLGKLNIAYGRKIPQSFLPYPKEILLEAFELINKDSYKLGDKHMMQLMHESAAELNSFIDDDEAFILAATNYSNPKWREAYAHTFKKFQKTWITTQDAPPID